MTDDTPEHLRLLMIETHAATIHRLHEAVTDPTVKINATLLQQIAKFLKEQDISINSLSREQDWRAHINPADLPFPVGSAAEPAVATSGETEADRVERLTAHAEFVASIGPADLPFNADGKPNPLFKP